MTKIKKFACKKLALERKFADVTLASEDDGVFRFPMISTLPSVLGLAIPRNQGFYPSLLAIAKITDIFFSSNMDSSGSVCFLLPAWIETDSILNPSSAVCCAQLVPNYKNSETEQMTNILSEIIEIHKNVAWGRHFGKFPYFHFSTGLNP